MLPFWIAVITVLSIAAVTGIVVAIIINMQKKETTCDVNKFVDGNTCKECPENTFSNGGTVTECKSCPLGFNLNSLNICVKDSSSPATLPSSPATLPIICHENCKTCNSVGESDCVTCNSGYEFFKINEDGTGICKPEGACVSTNILGTEIVTQKYGCSNGSAPEKCHNTPNCITKMEAMTKALQDSDKSVTDLYHSFDEMMDDWKEDCPGMVNNQMFRDGMQSLMRGILNEEGKAVCSSDNNLIPQVLRGTDEDGEIIVPSCSSLPAGEEFFNIDDTNPIDSNEECCVDDVEAIESLFHGAFGDISCTGELMTDTFFGGRSICQRGLDPLDGEEFFLVLASGCCQTCNDITPSPGGEFCEKRQYYDSSAGQCKECPDGSTQSIGTCEECSPCCYELHVQDEDGEIIKKLCIDDDFDIDNHGQYCNSSYIEDKLNYNLGDAVAKSCYSLKDGEYGFPSCVRCPNQGSREAHYCTKSDNGDVECDYGFIWKCIDNENGTFSAACENNVFYEVGSPSPSSDGMFHSKDECEAEIFDRNRDGSDCPPSISREVCPSKLGYFPFQEPYKLNDIEQKWQDIIDADGGAVTDYCFLGGASVDFEDDLNLWKAYFKKSAGGNTWVNMKDTLVEGSPAYNLVQDGEVTQTDLSLPGIHFTDEDGYDVFIGTPDGEKIDGGTFNDDYIDFQSRGTVIGSSGCRKIIAADGESPYYGCTDPGQNSNEVIDYSGEGQCFGGKVNIETFGSDEVCGFWVQNPPDPPVQGCMDDAACNFNESAVISDESCYYAVDGGAGGCTCASVKRGEAGQLEDGQLHTCYNTYYGLREDCTSCDVCVYEDRPADGETCYPK